MGVHAREGDLFAYPDVTVACGEPQYLGVQDTLLNPTLIVEVLSPSTELLDRSRKFKSYRSIESLREYLMVSSEEAVAELWTKLPDGKWPLTEADALEDSVELQSIGARLKLADVYEKAL
jgi:Uma2 family endonuclease